MSLELSLLLPIYINRQRMFFSLGQTFFALSLISIDDVKEKNLLI